MRFTARASAAAAAAAACCRLAPGALAEIKSPPLLQEPGATVLVAGATGGVGQLVTAKLLDVSNAAAARLTARREALPYAAKALRLGSNAATGEPVHRLII